MPMHAAGPDAGLATDIDDVDRGLINALLEDGRMTFRSMGARVGLAGDAVRERYNRLADAGIVRVVGVPDPRVLGYHAAAAIGVSVSGQVRAAAQELARIPEVSLVASTMGTFDVIFEILARDEQHLADLLDEHVRTIEAVHAGLTTMLYLDVLKWSFAHAPQATPSVAAASPTVDEVDRRLMTALQVDGRLPYTDLADRLGMSYANARRRTMHLIESGAVKITTSVNRLSMGVAVMAAVCIRVEGRRCVDVAEDLAALPEVEVIIQTLGTFDLLIEVACRDRSHLRDVISDGIRGIDGVTSTETFVYTSLQRLPVQWGVDTLSQVLRST
ncbi:Lrp/AsnC family transcriptional regulator [Streptomyces fuscichromogenes]|uniref:Lrp/AsnC family transcriptional regulator n=1 Tax=Streptomyces fuscichromogenes TaxID=1324013 RepID=UPI00382DCCF7